MIPVGFERPEFLWLLLLAAPVIGLAFWSKRKIPLFRRLLALALRLALLVTIVFAIAGFTWQQAIDALARMRAIDSDASNALLQRAREDQVLGQCRDVDRAVAQFVPDALLEARQAAGRIAERPQAQREARHRRHVGLQRGAHLLDDGRPLHR